MSEENLYKSPDAPLEKAMVDFDNIENPHKLWLQIFGVAVSSILITLVGGWFVVPTGVLAFADAWHAGIYKNKFKGGFLNISPMAWAIVIQFLFILGYPIYVFSRSRLKTKRGYTALYVLTILAGIIPAFFVVMAIFTMINGAAG